MIMKIRRIPGTLAAVAARMLRRSPDIPGPDPDHIADKYLW
jgi:hypothetical protein